MLGRILGEVDGHCASNAVHSRRQQRVQAEQYINKANLEINIAYIIRGPLEPGQHYQRLKLYEYIKYFN